MLSRNLSELFAPKGLAEIVRPENLRSRKLKQQDSAVAATQETFTFEIPTDRLIHAIIISIGQDTTAKGVA